MIAIASRHVRVVMSKALHSCPFLPKLELEARRMSLSIAGEFILVTARLELRVAMQIAMSRRVLNLMNID